GPREAEEEGTVTGGVGRPGARGDRVGGRVRFGAAVQRHAPRGVRGRAVGTAYRETAGRRTRDADPAPGVPAAAARRRVAGVPCVTGDPGRGERGCDGLHADVAAAARYRGGDADPARRDRGGDAAAG